jgi:hypothetical protein
VALASGHLGAQADGDRTTVVVHTDLGDVMEAKRHATLDDGSLIHPDTAARLLCDGRLRTVLHQDGTTVGIGHASRVVPAWLGQQVRRIYGCCSFPGCHSRRFLVNHHADPWPWGPYRPHQSRSPVCLHHRLVHEGGWKVKIKGEGIVEVLRPDGRVFVPGPAPPV